MAQLPLLFYIKHQGMKAIVHTKYGPPEVAQLQEIEKPMPQRGEILIRVMASTVNRTDAGFRSAEYFISRFWSGLFRPKVTTLGCEFSGVVEAIGEHVTDYHEGEKVFGFNDKTFGGHGEYLTISEKAAMAIMPQNCTFEQASAISEGAHYALCNIRAAKVAEGQHVLVYGATGAIGSAAVQLLKAMHVHVTAVCNSKNVLLVKSLGADVVIDYQNEDFTKTSQQYDFVFDAVGKSSFGECKPLLKKKGIYISTEFGKRGENIWFALFTPMFGGKRLLFPLPTVNKEDIVFLKNLVEAKKFMPVIDRTYSLAEIVDAYKYVESGQKTGNIVIKIAK